MLEVGMSLFKLSKYNCATQMRSSSAGKFPTYMGLGPGC